MSDHNETDNAGDAVQGYLTMAYGPRKYYEMTVDLALSLKLFDPERPLTLLHAGEFELSDRQKALFGHVVEFDQSRPELMRARKLQIHKYTPYKETLFIDADSIVMRDDMDRHWKKFSQYDFNTPSEIRRDGVCYGLSVEEMKKAAGTDYIAQINSGVVYFKSNPAGRRVFETAQEFLLNGNLAFVEKRRNRGFVYADQPFFGAAMAKCGVALMQYGADEDTIMATTYLARRCRFDLDEGHASLDKPTGFWVLNRFFAKGWVRHRTSVAHFIGLKPRAAYQDISNTLRDRHDIPRFQYS